MRRIFILAVLTSWVSASSAQESKNTQSVNPGFEGSKAGESRELMTGFTFQWCPAGTFLMGSPKSEDIRKADEGPAKVTLSSGFWLGETELTQKQWHQVMGTSPWKGIEYIKEGASYPACYITYAEAVSFCDKLTNQEQASGRLPKDWKFSLPTEAQWEYACRAGTTTRFSFGNDASQLSQYGWWGGLYGEGNAKDEQYAHQVGLKKPNAWGLKDMHGNVREWCSDWFDDKLKGGRDPMGPLSGEYRSNRGGSWSVYPNFCRTALRFNFNPDDQYADNGFRLAVVRPSK